MYSNSAHDWARWRNIALVRVRVTMCWDCGSMVICRFAGGSIVVLCGMHGMFRRPFFARGELIAVFVWICRGVCVADCCDVPWCSHGANTCIPHAPSTGNLKRVQMRWGPRWMWLNISGRSCCLRSHATFRPRSAYMRECYLLRHQWFPSIWEPMFTQKKKEHPPSKFADKSIRRFSMPLVVTNTVVGTAFSSALPPAACTRSGL